MEQGDRMIHIRYPATAPILNFFRKIFGLPKVLYVSASYPVSLAKMVKDTHGINLRAEVMSALKVEHAKMLEK